MTCLSLKIMKKIDIVRNYYKDYSLVGEDVTDLNVKLYASMQRWHLNGHISERDWYEAFEISKVKLKTKNSFLAECMPLGMSEFLTRKFKNTTLKGRFQVSDIFPEGLESKIYGFFVDLNAEEAAEMSDEFDVENVTAGLPTDLINYFKHTFSPLAYFYTYQHKHSDAPDKHLMEDCFNLGAGSRREDLFPEVNPYCEMCCDSFGSSESSYQELNFKLYKIQVENKFNLPYYGGESDEDLSGDGPESNEDLLGDGLESDEDLSVKGPESDEVLSVKGPESDEDLSVDGPDENITEKIISNDVVENPFLSSSSSHPDSVNGEVMENKNSEVFEKDNAEVMENENAEVLKVAKCLECKKAFSKELFLVMHSEVFHSKKQKIKPVFVDENEEHVDLITSFYGEEIVSSTEHEKEKSKVCGRGRGKGGIPKKRPAEEIVVKKTVRKSLRFEKS